MDIDDFFNFDVDQDMKDVDFSSEIKQEIKTRKKKLADESMSSTKKRKIENPGAADSSTENSSKCGKSVQQSTVSVVEENSILKRILRHPQLGRPVLVRELYKLGKLDNVETEIDISNVQSVGNEKENKCKMRIQHSYICKESKKILIEPDCENCIKFSEFPEKFIIVIFDSAYLFPSPTVISNVYHQFLNNLLSHAKYCYNLVEELKAALLLPDKMETCRLIKEKLNDASGEHSLTGVYTNKKLNQPIAKALNEYSKQIFDENINDPDKRMKLLEKSINQIKISIDAKYTSTCSKAFTFGDLSEQFRGKQAFARQFNLSSSSFAIRLVLTINTSLGPDEIRIPKGMFDRINPSVQFGFVNRAPSINLMCCQAVRIFSSENSANNSTVEISPFLCDGLHADCDGDELVVMIITDKGLYSQLIAMEMLSNTFAYGSRVTMSYTPRFSFGQYFYYVMYLDEHQAVLNKIFPGYDKLPCKRANRPKFLMNLLCSIYWDRGIQVISDVIDYFGNLVIPTPSVSDILGLDSTDNGTVDRIVDSGSKGSAAYKEQVFKQLRNYDLNREETEREYFESAKQQFNKYVGRSLEVSSQGRNLFIGLEAVFNFSAQSNHLQFLDTVVVENFHRNPAFFAIQFNADSLKFFLHSATSYYEEASKRCNVVKIENVNVENDIFNRKLYETSLNSDEYESSRHFETLIGLLSHAFESNYRRAKSKTFDFYPLAYSLALLSTPRQMMQMILLTDYSADLVELLERMLSSRKLPGFGLDSVPIGMIILERNSDSLQEGLSVKRFEAAKSTDREVLSDELGHEKFTNICLKPTIGVYLHDYEEKEIVWFRVKYVDKMKLPVRYPDAFKIYIGQNNYAELYFRKHKKTGRGDNFESVFLLNVMDTMESDENILRIVFCSNLRFIKKFYNSAVIFGHILAFFTCYGIQTMDIDYNHHTKVDILAAQLRAFIFLFTNDMNTLKLSLTSLREEKSLSKFRKLSELKVGGNIISVDSAKEMALTGTTAGGFFSLQSILMRFSNFFGNAEKLDNL